MLYLLVLQIAVWRSLGGSLLSPAQQAAPTPSAAAPQVFLSAPLPGEALQGSVSITGRTRVPGFQRAELSFAYQDDPRSTWFLIAEFEEPSDENLLADWDTTTLTDGDYRLRLVVYRRGNREPMETIVAGLRVRNYTPLETNTPAPTPTALPGDTPAPTATPTRTATPIPPTPTPFPTNAAMITPGEITTSMGKGALLVILAFASLGLYSALRRALHRRAER